jgi:hypothetical protein
MFGFGPLPCLTSQARKTLCRPGVEALEAREVLSTASPAIHAVAGPPRHPLLLQTVFLNAHDHLLYQGNADGEGLSGTPLNGQATAPHGVTEFSVGHDVNGSLDVFAKAGDTSLWKFQPGTGWTELAHPRLVRSFAAVEGGRAFAIFQDGTLHRYAGNDWSLVTTPGTVKALDAITDKSGLDNVLVLNGDNSFGQLHYLPPTPLHLQAATTHAAVKVGNTFPGPTLLLQPIYTQLVAAGRLVLPGHHVGTFARVTKFSAGTDIHGKADVYATWTGGILRREVGSTGSWTTVALAGTFKDYSAVDKGQVWLIGPDSSLVIYNNSGQRNDVGNLGLQFVSLSGVPASGHYSQAVFGVSTNGIIAEYYVDPVISFPVFDQLTAPGTAIR